MGDNEDLFELGVELSEAAARRLIARFKPRKRPVGEVSFLVAGSRLDAIGRVVDAGDLGATKVEVRGPDLLDALSIMDEARRDVDEYELRLIRLARRDGLSWRQISAGLGLDSPQAAQQRYQRLGGDGAAAWMAHPGEADQ